TQAELHRYRSSSLNHIEDWQVVNRLKETGKVVLHDHFEVARAWSCSAVISRCVHRCGADWENGTRSRTTRYTNTRRTTISGSQIERKINHDVSRTTDDRRSRIYDVHYHVVCIRSSTRICNCDRVRVFR